MLANYQSKEVEYYQFDEDILALFNIESEEQLKKISEKLETSFLKQ